MPFTESDRKLLEEVHAAVVKPNLPDPDEPDWEAVWLVGGQEFTPDHDRDFLSIFINDAPAGTLLRYVLDVRLLGTPDRPNMQNLLLHLGANKGGAVKHRDLLLYSFWQGGRYTWRQGIGVPAGEKTKDTVVGGLPFSIEHEMRWESDRLVPNELAYGSDLVSGSDLIGGPLKIDQRGLWMHLGGKPVFENNEVAPVGVTFESVTLRLWYD